MLDGVKGRPQFYVVGRLHPPGGVKAAPSFFCIGAYRFANAPVSSLTTLCEVGGQNQRSAKSIVIDWPPNRCSRLTRPCSLKPKISYFPPQKPSIINDIKLRASFNWTSEPQTEARVRGSARVRKIQTFYVSSLISKLYR